MENSIDDERMQRRPGLDSLEEDIDGFSIASKATFSVKTERCDEAG